MDKTIFLIGSGLYNAIIANEFAKRNYKVKIFEQRNHIGGNCYDEIDDRTGILYHVYGPHILHFSDRRILEYLRKFSDFKFFHHEVKSVYKNRLYSIPINLSTINEFYKVALRPFEVKDFIAKKTRAIKNPQNMEEKCISLIGEDLYQAFFREYTLKQWETDPKNLPASTISRIPVRLNYNSSYYNKPYSYLPVDGFTNLIRNILDNKNISIKLGTKISLREVTDMKRYGPVIYTGALDELFEYEFGELKYRSLYFEKEYKQCADFQGLSVINYPELKYKWTRICEPRHFSHTQNLIIKSPETLIIKEYSCWKKKGMEAYYPINDDANTELYKRYKHQLSQLGNVYAGGRLGAYAYTDMENTINNALEFCKKF